MKGVSCSAAHSKQTGDFVDAQQDRQGWHWAAAQTSGRRARKRSANASAV